MVIGVKSTALQFEEDPKQWLGGFSLAMLLSFCVAGGNCDQTLPYLLGCGCRRGSPSTPEEQPEMAVTTVVTVQPQGGVASASRNMWQTGLMDCCSDCGVCCCGVFCFPCLACQVAGDMNECCLCGTSVAMRTLYRTRYNIPGSICSDFCTTTWCLMCSVCQLKRDIKRRKELGIF
ncbi:placenta-specific gene 8 protein-like [Athene cunicularia]|uniref:placenta-specific gene 8 protein-like n=1 Tax=Athene cunicularia TaxID=194338 RepID=UPI000EF6AE15|nr:placenta-specific gene 8 protein-like [Athene cunicularia]